MEAIWTPEELRLWFISCVSNEGLLVRATADLFFKDSYGCLGSSPALLPYRWLPACFSHCSATAHALSRPSAPRGRRRGGDSRRWAARSLRKPPAQQHTGVCSQDTTGTSGVPPAWLSRQVRLRKCNETAPDGPVNKILALLQGWPLCLLRKHSFPINTPLPNILTGPKGS